MRLLSLDFDPVYGGRETVRDSFAGDLSAFDFDVVIWDPAASYESYADFADTYMGLPSLDDSTSVRMQEAVARRKSEFVEFINAGRTLVVVGCPHKMCYVGTGKHTYSGTGRNQVDTRLVAEFDLIRALPSSAFKCAKAKGTQIEFEGTGPIPEFLRKYRNLFQYEAVFAEHPGQPLGKVKGTNRVVSYLLRTASGGLFIVIPRPNLAAPHSNNEDEDWSEDSDEGGWIEEAPKFQSGLLAAIRSTSLAGEVARPTWADSYSTKHLASVRESATKAQRAVERARTRLVRLNTDHADELQAEQLYLGSGRALELQVRDVFTLMGGSVDEPAPGRDDWRVAFPEGELVVEVKGVSKSAAEAHAAQLEKWVAGSYEETGNSHKGVLIVNAWKDMSLADRDSKVAFPPQMIPYSTSRKHCLITGLGLFIIRDDVQSDVSRAGHWRRRILNCDGVLTGLPHWRSVILSTETQKSEVSNSD